MLRLESSVCSVLNYHVNRPTAESAFNKSVASIHINKRVDGHDESWQLNSPLAAAHTEDSIHKNRSNIVFC